MALASTFIARYWWVFLVSGISWLILAWVVLRLNETPIATVGALLGVVFIAAGVTEAGLGSLVTGGWKLWHYVMAFIFFLGGLWGFIRPVDTFFALASVLGLILVLYGTFEIARAVAMRPVNPYWWIGVVSGGPLILLSFWVSGSDRVYALEARTYLILFWAGFMALFRGITLLMLAFGIRHAGEVAGGATEKA
jgi:uncharacterized membrane protein HdeD (DUF308 family)